MKAWYNFIVDRLAFDAMFIPVSILIVFALFNRKEYKNTGMQRFILTALAVSLFSRYVYFVYVDMKINTRYLFPAAFYLSILCVPGFTLLVMLFKKLTCKIKWIREIYLIILLLLMVAVGNIWKALGDPDVKRYIHGTAKIVRASAPAILISNLHDSRRVAWHSRAKLIPLSDVADINNPVNLGNSLKTLEPQNKNIFLIVKFKDNEFRKIFSDKKAQFPESLIFLKEFKARHGKFYSLYQVSLIKKNDRPGK
jgi:hypothetical protein